MRGSHLVGRSKDRRLWEQSFCLEGCRLSLTRDVYHDDDRRRRRLMLALETGERTRHSMLRPKHFAPHQRTLCAFREKTLRRQRGCTKLDSEPRFALSFAFRPKRSPCWL